MELPDVSRLIGLALVASPCCWRSAAGPPGAAPGRRSSSSSTARSGAPPIPTLGRDIGFYVFDLPFWRFLLGWASTALIIVGLLTLATYAARALRWQFHLSAPVRAHLSVIGALLLVVIAAGYQLDIAELAYSTRGWDGNVQAALYTDMNAQYPAYEILTVVALVSAGLLLLNTWFRTLWLLGLAAGAWFLLSILVGGLYPAFVQRVQVEPNELNVELPYLRNHLEATRDAFDLDAIETRRFTGEQELTREVFSEDQATIDNLRLWDYRPLLTTFGQQQILRRYYRFPDVDIDRYQIDDEQREIMLQRARARRRAVRPEPDLDPGDAGLHARLRDHRGPGRRGHRGRHARLSRQRHQPRAATADHRAAHLLRRGDRYVRRDLDHYGRVRLPARHRCERRSGDEHRVGGTTGVDIGNPISRLLFALRFGDFNLLISSQLTDDSQILFRRDIEERVREIAPFLAYDHDPYLVSADGRLYGSGTPTPSPIATRTPSRSARTAASPARTTCATASRSSSTPTTARSASTSPILTSRSPPPTRGSSRASSSRSTRCRRSFGAPALSRGPVRRPEPGLPALPPARDRRRGDDLLQPGRPLGDPRGRHRRHGEPMEPYYVIMRIPGEDEAEFVLIQPMVPEGRPNMIAWVAARMDPGVYGERIAFQFPTGTTTQGPVQIEARINADDAISEQFTLWSNAGSHIVRGNLLVLPIGEDALFYVEPIFLQAQDAPFPEFVRVIMADQDRVAFAETVEEGLAQLLGEAEPPPPEEPGAVAVAGRVAGAVAIADPGRAARRRRRAGRGGAAPLRRGAGRAGGWRPGHLPGAYRRARRGARRPGRADHPAVDILVLGAGAREHALAWRLARDEGVRLVRIAPGNGGTVAVGETVDLDPTDPMAVARHAARERYDLVVIGPEAPLARASPTSSPRHAIPDLRTDARRGTPGVEQGLRKAPDGAGRGADRGIGHFHRSGRGAGAPPSPRSPAGGEGRLAGRGQGRRRARHHRGGGGGRSRPVRAAAAGARVCSRSALTGRGQRLRARERLTVVPLAAARDYKRLGDGDTGPNTGGMGAFAPVPWFGRDALERTAAEVFEPIAWRMARDGTPYRGVLYAGLMLTADGPMVLEFNARFGDPEAQVLLPLLDGELSRRCSAAPSATAG